MKRTSHPWRQLTAVVLSLVAPVLFSVLMFGWGYASWIPLALYALLILALATAAYALWLEPSPNRGYLALQIGVIWLLGFLLAPMLVPTGHTKASAMKFSCLSNIKQQARGMILYSEEFDGLFPPADRWQRATLPFVKEAYYCPENYTSLWSYAMNSQAEGLSVGRVLSPEQLPLIFEGNASLPDASGGPEWVVFRHDDKTNIAFADGHASRVDLAKLAKLKWKP